MPQSRDLEAILSHAEGWTGSRQDTLAWYRVQPLPSFGGQTAAALVEEGRASAVLAYLDWIAVGGYA